MTTPDTDTTTQLPIVLDPVQARVLACLVEKEATTPEQYPLTANAVQVACNQKTAREPMMSLEPGAVGHALRTLETAGLVRSIHGSRAQRYDHRMDDVYAISPEQRHLLALLMLRGAQTAGELLARSDRLHAYRDAEHVRQVLERLESRSPALVLRLPRASGQREDRYAHLLCGEPAVPNRQVFEAAAPERSGASTTASSDELAELQRRVDALEGGLASLRALVLGQGSHPSPPEQ